MGRLLTGFPAASCTELHGNPKKSVQLTESVEFIERRKPRDRLDLAYLRVSALLNGVQEVAGSNPVAPT
jgi:hypothetical protein